LFFAAICEAKTAAYVDLPTPPLPVTKCISFNGPLI
jgi:hypothetical protein